MQPLHILKKAMHAQSGLLLDSVTPRRKALWINLSQGNPYKDGGYNNDNQVQKLTDALSRSSSSVIWRKHCYMMGRIGSLIGQGFQKFLGLWSTMGTSELRGQSATDSSNSDTTDPRPPPSMLQLQMSLMWDLVDPMLLFQCLSTGPLLLGWVLSLTIAVVGHVVTWRFWEEEQSQDK